MRCPESEALLQRLLDGEALDDRAALDRHLAECALCREQHAAAARLLDDGLPALCEGPPALWTARVIAAIVTDDRRRRWRRNGLAALAAAASILLAIVTVWFWHRPTESHGRATDLQARQLAKATQSTPPEREPSLRATVAEAEEAVKSLSNRIADNTVERVRTLLAASASAEVGPMPTLPTVASIEQPLDPAARSLQGTGRGVSTGLQTVANSARRAFDFLLSELPPAAP
jgi:hypothetical protein